MKGNKQIRVVIDTNLWISFIISNRINLLEPILISNLEPILISNKVRLLFSEKLINEIRETIKKPKLRKYFAANSVDEMLEVFEPFIELIDVTSQINVCRDPQDDFLLELSKDGKANYLVTGDNDLLVMEKLGLTEIMKISDFIKKVSGE